MIATNIPMNVLKLQYKENLILNLGCGQEEYGDVRVDFVKTPTTTHVWDLNLGLPFQKAMFTEVYSKSVLEHIKNLDNFVREIRRVLRLEGKFWIRTDNASYLPFLFRNHQDCIEGTYEHHTSDDMHYHLFKEEHLRNLFRDFKDLEIEYTCPNKKLFFLPKKFKCMYIEIKGGKRR